MTKFCIIHFFLPSFPLSFLVSLFLSLSHDLCTHPKFSGAHMCFIVDSVCPPCELRGVCGPWCGQGHPVPLAAHRSCSGRVSCSIPWRFWWFSLSVVSNSATPWIAAHQAPLFLGFSRQDYWSGLPFPPPGGLPDPEIKPRSPAQ